MSGPWHCPTCLRSVPPRVETCYCGTSREQAERVARAAEPDSTGGRLPWIPLALVVVALGVLVISLRGRDPEPAPPPPPPPASAPAPRPPPRSQGSPPRGAVAAPRRPAPVRALPPPPPAPAATPAPVPAEPEDPEEPDPDDGLDARREEARAALQARLAALAARRDALGERLRAWDASCGTGSSAVRPAGCVLLQEDIEALVDEVDAGLREAEVEARRGWVAPGDRRRLLESVELDSRTWGALRRRAADALR